MKNETLTGETLGRIVGETICGLAPVQSSDVQMLYDSWKQHKATLTQLEPFYAERHAELEEKLAAVKHEWEVANAEFLGIWNGQAAAIAETETALRQTVIDAYEANGKTDKQIAPGCSIRVNTKLEYNVVTALEFAKSHGICLKLDTKEFEKVAPTICPELVTPIETVTAVLSSK